MPRIEEWMPGIPHKKGDLIGNGYHVLGILGRGGFGVAYVVYSEKHKLVFGLKTLRDEYLAVPDVKEAFRREALTWVNLGRHPYLLSALWVEECGGRLYVWMEFIAPDKRGRNSL